MSAMATKQQFPGMAIGLLRDRETIWLGGYGFASMETAKQVDPETDIFRAASASKPIAATALAMLVENGIMDLDASFYDYVPYYPKKEYDFNIRQLASHTAGIRGYRGKEYALNKPLTIRESVEIFQDEPLLFKPGTSYLYNSFDWVLISLAMEEASGMSFEQYVSENVLLPLGMKDTLPELPDESLKRKVGFYTKTGSGFRKSVEVDNRYKLAGGGYLTTISDLLLLGRSYLEDSLIAPDISNEFLTAVQVKDQSTFYGLGWEVSSDRHGRPFFGHTGNSVGAYSNFYVYPEQNAVIAILINCTDPKIQYQLDKVMDALLKL